MKRLGIAALGAVMLVLLLVAPALAQSVIEEPPEIGPEVIFPDVVTRPGGQAFTGIDVTVWMVLAAALLLLGVAFLVAASRRARTAGNSGLGDRFGVH